MASASVSTPLKQISTAVASETVLAEQPKTHPFVVWHLRGKFRVMEGLFRKYLGPGAKFADIACGTGDGLVLASLCRPDCELWGLDIDRPSLDIAQRRTPLARLVEGNMLSLENLPRGYFDAVHEFGATFMVDRWDTLVGGYLSLLRDGGVLLWELPHKWSTAHIAYLFSVAPKITDADTKLRRIFRSFLPSKYRFESDKAIFDSLKRAGCDYEIIETVPIWHFYCRGLLCWFLEALWKLTGDGLFNWLDRVTSRVWPRCAGYYLVIKKLRTPGIE